MTRSNNNAFHHGDVSKSRRQVDKTHVDRIVDTLQTVGLILFQLMFKKI